MRKMFWITAVLLFGFGSTTIAGRNEYDEAVRYIKLGSSYREGADYNNALKYLNLSNHFFMSKTDWQGRYWFAASEEYMGFVYKDMKMYDEAFLHFSKALDIYNRLIDQKDGSPAALQSIINSIDNIELEKNTLNTSPGPGKSSGYRYSGDIINLDNQKLKSIPSDLPKNIKNLSISDNRIKEFPNLNGFNSLQYLNLSGNRIRKIESFSVLPNLKWLDLSNNNIKDLKSMPEGFAELEYLDLSNNNIKDLPAVLFTYSNLKLINLKGNPVEFNQISNLIRALPNTNILHDRYVPVQDIENTEE